MISNALVITLGIVAAAGVINAAPQDAGPSTDNAVLMEVQGAKLTMSDLEQKSAVALFQARTNYYEAERKVLEDAAAQMILEQQAAKEGLTVTQLLDKHVNSTIAADPSEEALHVYFEGVDTNEPYEAVRAKIVEALRQRRIAKAKAAYMQSLRAQSTIVIRLAPPRAPVSMKNVPVRGEASAKVTLLEFADFECPYCQQLQPVLTRIEAEYKGKVDFAYKDFPLPMHPDAPKAAEAAHCADAQGKYWEFHDIMYKQQKLDVASLKNYSTELNLDTAKFAACLDKGEMAGVVNEQAAEAQALGLQGTPSILVNGRLLNGTLNYEKIKALLDEELSAISYQESSNPRASNKSSAPPRL